MRNVIEIREDVSIPGTNVTLEKGDRIEILREYNDEIDEVNDAFISSNGFRYSVSASGEFLGEFIEWDDAVEELKNWMERNRYWPTVWFVDDHGGIDAINIYESIKEQDPKKIKAKNPGILEVPENKDVQDMSEDHFKGLIKKKGWAAISRALVNLIRWNKKQNPTLSKWADSMQSKLHAWAEKQKKD